MATLLLSYRPLFRTAALGAGLGLSLLHPSSPLRSSPLQCQYNAPYYNRHASPETGWSLDPNSPIVEKQGRTSPAAGNRLLSAWTVRQISLGSVLGLAAGLGLRVFSKALVFVLGVGIVLVEWAASKGYNVIPVNFLQKHVKINLRDATRKNVPLKVSFGTTMAMAAFANFSDYS
ncbi:hypothetical protein PISL3812_04251 [Talaromyces islandicus]|uniref:FUN14 family protein n=1 Tax=Talaromyces islandicus TaxID=28573 RepID=A0A0U1LUZ7_TALIS|nr:hypothetical protein PISL3812_04251 [Talaromyces islandicus]